MRLVAQPTGHAGRLTCSPANTERPHQGLEGRTPAEVSTAVPETEVIDLAAVRLRRLVRHAYAHGLLQGYALVEADEPREAG